MAFRCRRDCESCAGGEEAEVHLRMMATFLGSGWVRQCRERRPDLAKHAGSAAVGPTTPDDRATHHSERRSQERRRRSDLEDCSPSRWCVTQQTENQPHDPTGDAGDNSTHSAMTSRERQVTQHIAHRGPDSIHEPTMARGGRLSEDGRRLRGDASGGPLAASEASSGGPVVPGNELTARVPLCASAEPEPERS